MRIAVLGAAGRTGREVVSRALARGWDVSALVRASSDSPGVAADLAANDRVTVHEGDARSERDLRAAIRGAEAVISTLGSHGGQLGPLYADAAAALVAAMNAEHVCRVIVLSTRALGDTASAGDASDAPSASSDAVHDDLRAMEDALTGSDLEWTIMRPSRLIAGALGDYETRVGALFERGRETRRADLADAILNAIERRLWIREDVAIVSC